MKSTLFLLFISLTFSYAQEANIDTHGTKKDPQSNFKVE